MGPGSKSSTVSLTAVEKKECWSRSSENKNFFYSREQLITIFLLNSRIEQRIEQEFVSAVGLSAELTADADKNDASFLVLNIDHSCFARNHIFSQEPSAQKDVFLGVAGYDFSIPFP